MVTIIMAMITMIGADDVAYADLDDDYDYDNVGDAVDRIDVGAHDVDEYDGDDVDIDDDGDVGDDGGYDDDDDDDYYEDVSTMSAAMSPTAPPDRAYMPT